MKLSFHKTIVKLKNGKKNLIYRGTRSKGKYFSREDYCQIKKKGGGGSCLQKKRKFNLQGKFPIKRSEIYYQHMEYFKVISQVLKLNFSKTTAKYNSKKGNLYAHEYKRKKSWKAGSPNSPLMGSWNMPTIWRAMLKKNFFNV